MRVCVSVRHESALRVKDHVHGVLRSTGRCTGCQQRRRSADAALARAPSPKRKAREQATGPTNAMASRRKMFKHTLPPSSSVILGAAPAQVGEKAVRTIRSPSPACGRGASSPQACATCSRFHPHPPFSSTARPCCAQGQTALREHRLNSVTFDQQEGPAGISSNGQLTCTLVEGIFEVGTADDKDLLAASKEAKHALRRLRTVNASFLSNLDYVSLRCQSQCIFFLDNCCNARLGKLTLFLVF